MNINLLPEYEHAIKVFDASERVEGPIWINLADETDHIVLNNAEPGNDNTSLIFKSPHIAGTNEIPIPEDAEELSLMLVYKVVNTGNSPKVLIGTGPTRNPVEITGTGWNSTSAGTIKFSRQSSTTSNTCTFYQDTYESWNYTYISFIKVGTEYNVEIWINGIKINGYEKLDSIPTRLSILTDTSANRAIEIRHLIVYDTHLDKASIRNLYNTLKDLTEEPLTYWKQKTDILTDKFHPGSISNSGAVTVGGTDGRVSQIVIASDNEEEKANHFPIPFTTPKELKVKVRALYDTGRDLEIHIALYSELTGGFLNKVARAFTHEVEIDFSEYVNTAKYYRLSLKYVNDNDSSTSEYMYSTSVTTCQVTWYANIRWTGSDISGVTNLQFPYMPDRTMMKPYPDSKWRITTGFNDNQPYNLLMPQIPKEEVIYETFNSPNIFSIMCDGVEIYNTSVPDIFCQLLNPKLTLESGQAGSLAFVMPPNHFYYNKMDIYNSRFVVLKNGKYYWSGRILTTEVDFYNNRQIVCEGIMSYLNDTCQPQVFYGEGSTAWDILQGILNYHNIKVSDDKKFYIGACRTDEIKDGWVTEYESTLTCIVKLAEQLKCKLHTRRVEKTDEFGNVTIRNEVIIYDELQNDSEQRIIFGSNLMDFTRSYDLSSLVTVLLPLGKLSDTGNKSYVGEAQTPSQIIANECLCLDENNHFFYQHNLPNRYQHLVFDQFKEGQIVYITTRMPKDENYTRVAYAIWLKKDGEYQYYDGKTISKGIGVDDISQDKITIPAGDIRIEVFGDNDVVEPTLNLSKATKDTETAYITIEPVNGGSPYLKATPRTVEYTDYNGNKHTETIDPIAKFGYIEKAITFDEVTNPQELLEAAQKYLNDYQFDDMTIEVNAMDLVNLGYKTESLELLQRVHVISPPHGVDKWFPIDKMEIVLNDPTANIYTLNNKDKYSITQTNNDIDQEMLDFIRETPPPSAVLEAAKKDAAYILEQGTKGVVTLNRDPNDPDGPVRNITIAAGPDWKSDPEQPHWIFNENGLGFMYTENGEVKKATDALTVARDPYTGKWIGRIVADAITAGLMSADRMRGGELKLGAYGVAEVPDTVPDGKLTIMARKDPSDPHSELIEVFRGDYEGVQVTGKTTTKSKGDSGEYVRLEDGSCWMGNNTDSINTQMNGNAVTHNVGDQHVFTGLMLQSNDIDIRTGGTFAINGGIGQTAEVKYVSDISVSSTSIDGHTVVTKVEPVFSYITFRNGIVIGAPNGQDYSDPRGWEKPQKEEEIINPPSWMKVQRWEWSPHPSNPS